jgi:hypothetical protein
MKSRLILVLVCTSMLSGCSATARLYPVQGPLSTQTPSPVYVAKFTGAFNSGNFSAVLGDGEVCKGRWELVPPPTSSKAATPPGVPSANNLSAEWDTIYGPGFYSKEVLGADFYMRAVLTGNRGTDLNVEMYANQSPEPSARHDNPITRIMKGVAKDNKGNIYNMVFP